MENLKSQSDSQLLTQIKNLATTERKITLEILHFLKELDRRRLHCGLGYSSLFTFCVKELHYSESQAYRRIQAMRALSEIPEIESKIEKGKLSIATVSQVQSFFQNQTKVQKEGIRPGVKIDVLKLVEGKSKREVEKILTSIAPQTIPQDKVRILDGNHSEIRFVANERLLEKLRRIRDLMSHQEGMNTYAELFEKMADLALDKIDPERKAMRLNSNITKTGTQLGAKTSVGRTDSPNSKQAIPAAVRREVWKKSGGRCSFIDPDSKRRCDSTRYLELDHQVPRAHGGGNELENLRLYCRNHNVYAAVQVFGERKMAEHIPSLK